MHDYYIHTCIIKIIIKKKERKNIFFANLLEWESSYFGVNFFFILKSS